MLFLSFAQDIHDPLDELWLSSEYILNTSGSWPKLYCANELILAH